MIPRVSARVGCAILAAGAGTRFGAGDPKLVGAVRGRPLLQPIIDAACASSAVHVSVILGARADEVFARVDTRRCAVLLNEGWKEGLAASIRCAVAAHRADDALVVLLGDQPNVTSHDIDALIEIHLRDARSIAVLRCGEVWGAPALFPQSYFPALDALRGDAGAKRLAASHDDRLTFVDAEMPDAFADVDTRADLVTPPIAR